ncbi:3-deoxy-D-manno-octulosonic acid kinase [Kaarinaea lacus]
MKPARSQQNQDYFLYDRDMLDQVGCPDFDVGYYQQQGALRGQAQGRGTTHFISIAGKLDCVLRHYRRGGLVARVTEDRYYWSGLDQTRAWREWLLLQLMCEEQLPVPHPVAAHVKRSGFFYTADIITQQIPAAHSLATVLGKGELSDDLWRCLGKTIRQFHQRGIYHADLNAHNILIDESERFYLIDFDKGALRRPSPAWQQANIDRLQRSLQKLKQQNQDQFQFALHHWGALLQAYSSGS